MVKPTNRRSRQDKVELILHEHRQPTQFETQFYNDLIAYKVTLQSDTPILRQRSYMVGRVYIMHGGVLSKEDCAKLSETFDAVGLKMTPNSKLCEEPTPQSTSPTKPTTVS